MLADNLITNFLFNLFPHSSFFDNFFLFVSAAGDFAVVWLVLFIILVIFEEVEHKNFIILFVGGLVFAYFLVNIILKDVFQRPRPFQVYSQIEKLVPKTSRPENYSFPSGHAATSFLAATLLAYYHRKRRLIFYSLAALVSYSRIYLGVHYFFDVVFGGVLGVLIAKLLILISYGFCEKTKKG